MIVLILCSHTKNCSADEAQSVAFQKIGQFCREKHQNEWLFSNAYNLI